MKNTIIILLFNVFLILLLGEITLRCMPNWTEKPPPYNTAILDNEIGWLQKGGYEYEGEQSSLNQETYPVKLTYKSNGFRNYGKLNTELPRVLVIGDSFTQAIEVSNGKAYYDYLEQNKLFEVFAYGMAGFGTLQEYMILDKYVEEIKPNVVLVQFCSNDFIDNEVEMEKESLYKVGLWRPYLQEDGSIRLDNPLGTVERYLIKSEFLKFFRDLWRQSKYGRQESSQNPSEKQIVTEGDKFKPYKRSKIVTKMILEKIKSRIPKDTTLYVLNADGYQRQQEDLEKICSSLGISFIRFPEVAMQQARKEAEIFTEDGFHWNERGHRVIGENLKQVLLTHK